MSEYFVLATELIKEHGLENVDVGLDLGDKKIINADVNRPALQLAGFYDYFINTRPQIIGLVEYTYLKTLPETARVATFRRLFEHEIPCMILCHGLQPFPELYDLSREFGVPVMISRETTNNCIGELIRWLRVQLAPRLTQHGVLVDVFGEGLLIIGESGIGKSETALELIQRGHRLIADDAVEIKRVSSRTLIGSCPEIIRYFIELRGIGIIDVKQMFGVEAIKATQSIDLVIKLEQWDSGRDYDRFGFVDEYIEILGNNVVCVTIPVKPGRNLAVICESAAINHRQKKLGYNAAQILSDRMDDKLLP